MALFRGTAFTLATIVALALLAQAGRPLSAPGPVLLLAVVHAALAAGWRGGIVSVVLTLAYTGWGAAQGTVSMEQFWVQTAANAAAVAIVVLMGRRPRG